MLNIQFRIISNERLNACDCISSHTDGRELLVVTSYVQ